MPQEHEAATLFDDIDLGELIAPNVSGQAGLPPLPAGRREVLYFDIETVPDESRAERFGLEPVPPEVAESDLMPPDQFVTQDLGAIRDFLGSKSPPSAWLERVRDCEQSAKKPRKGLFDAIEEIAGRAEASRKTMSVTPEFCRIVALGWGFASQDESYSLVVGPQPHGGQIREIDLLDHFWGLAKRSSKLIGFNILHFDLPTLFVRSALLGVPATRRIDMRPWGADCIDLMLARWPKGGQKPLKDLARILGLDVPAEGVEGSQVYQLWRDDPAKLAAYVQSDIAVTRQLHRFYNGFFC